MNPLEKENGTALVVTLGLLFLVTLLGMSTFRWSMDELGIAANQKASVQARYLAESGADLFLQWFQEPEAFPEIGSFPAGYPAGDRAGFLKRRHTNSIGAPSFFNDQGESQFTGTAARPDFEYQTVSDDTALAGEAFTGIGALTRLAFYQPASAGSIGTVEAEGTTVGGIRQTVRIEIRPSPIPPSTAAVQIGEGSDVPAPIRVHWGDVRVMGGADLGGALSDIPKKDPTAPLDGRPYADSERRDAWLDFYAGGPIVNPPTDGCPGCTEPFWSEGYVNLHQYQANGSPNFGLDPWAYPALKSFAKTWGTYYASDTAGFLYRDGIRDLAHRVTPTQALSSNQAGDDRGFVFIDTVDQNAPNGGNLAEIDLPVDYLEGIFSIQAHVVLREAGPGRAVQAQTPPWEGTEDASTRQTVVLSSIHLKGILSVAGRLAVEGRPMIFGSLIAQEGLSGSGQPEVWYDADLRAGYYPGLPTVTRLKGSWYMR